MKLPLVAFFFVVVGLISCTDGISEHRVTDTNTRSQQLLPTPTEEPYKMPDRSKYEAKNEGVFGLYYFIDGYNSDERKLIISKDNKPIPPKANDPDESTIPGFYLSHNSRIDFEEVEVIGDQVYFKTLEVDGICYEFRGKSGERIEPNFSDEIHVPFIKGTIKTIKGNVVTKIENVELGHAVNA